MQKTAFVDTAETEQGSVFGSHVSYGITQSLSPFFGIGIEGRPGVELFFIIIGGIYGMYRFIETKEGSFPNRFLYKVVTPMSYSPFSSR